MAHSRQAGWLAIVVTCAVGLASCGDDDGDDGAAPPSAEPEEIVIKTQVTIPTGKVASGSTLGGKPFCPGGTFRDTESDDDEAVGLIDRTIRCADGTVRIGFSPGKPQNNAQTGPWKVVSGTGAYEGMTGSGTVEATFPGGAKTGRETFTGITER